MTPERGRAARPLYASVVLPRIRALRYVDAAARGRVAARHRRGRRPRHLRLQVPRRRPGPQGAGRRGDRRRAGPARSGCARPTCVVVELDARDRPLRGRRGGPGPAHRERRAQPRRRLPARLVRLRRLAAARRRRMRRAHPLARRVHRQRRPHLAQPQPAGLARPASGRSTTAPRCTSTTPGRGGRPAAERFAGPALRRLDPRARATSPATCRPPTPSSRRRSPPTCSATCSPLVPDEWLEPAPGCGDPASGARGVRRTSCWPGVGRRPGLAARAAAAAGMSARWSATSTSCCAACRASTARSSSTSGVVLYCQAADFLDAALPRRPRPAAGSRPGRRPRRRATAPCAPSRRSAAATTQPRPAGRWPGIGTRFGFLKAPRSTVVQPGPVHGGLTADPAATLPALVGRLVG